MNRFSIQRVAPIAVLVTLTAAASGCAREKAPTPPVLQARFDAMLDTLDAESPGAATVHLEAFLQEAKAYQIADSVEGELARIRTSTEGRYHEARDLAREGHFDLAEVMLQDLARVPGTPDGESARKHLEYEFYMEKARWLLVRQRFDEAEAVARSLLSRDLNRFQTDEVERILDYSGQGTAVMDMTSAHNAKNACQQLIVFLANVYVNEGAYPSSLSLSDLERLDQYGGKSIQGQLSSIDDYDATQDHYSLVAVSKGGHRFRIVDGEIKD